MKFLILLLMAHFIGDFFLQPNSWVASKFRHGLASSGFWKHILTHGFLLLIIGLLYPANTWEVIIVFVLHVIIDALKIKYLSIYKSQSSRVYSFIIDQLLHILVIILVVMNTSLAFNLDSITQTPYLLIILGYLFITFPTSAVIKILLSPYTQEIEYPITERKERSWFQLFFEAPTIETPKKSLTNGGKYIGILERILVFTFILIGQWAAVGFLITAKSVIRFGDLNQGKNRQFTEYVLIGTLLSFGIAVFAAILVKHLLTLNLT